MNGVTGIKASLGVKNEAGNTVVTENHPLLEGYVVGVSLPIIVNNNHSGCRKVIMLFIFRFLLRHGLTI